MTTEAEWRATAKKVRNWGRWGPKDELGTLNFITPAKLKQAAACVKQGKLFPLGVDFDANGPQGAAGSRRNPIHFMSLDGGDVDMVKNALGWDAHKYHEMSPIWQAGPMRYNDDWIIMPLQAATQWDALSHVYYDGQMYNGYPASCVTSLGAAKDSIDKVDQKGVVSRGVLLDVAHHRKAPHLPPNTPIYPDDLDAVAKAEGVTIESGDVVIVRTGWWRVFQEKRERDTWAMGSPGLSWKCAEWLWKKEAAAVACDNVAVEVLPPEIPGVMLALHLLVIRDMGMMLGEMWNLEALSADCAKDGVYTFQIVAPPLRVTGAVGSPINPIAIK
jgi:kynurenine formamidase